MHTPAYDPRDVDDLAEVLRTVRERHPDAVHVMFDVLDEGDRGYRITDVVLGGERSLAVVDVDALAELDGDVYPLASNLAWRGVLGSSQYGCALVPVDWCAPVPALV